MLMRICTQWMLGGIVGLRIGTHHDEARSAPFGHPWVTSTSAAPPLFLNTA